MPRFPHQHCAQRMLGQRRSDHLIQTLTYVLRSLSVPAKERLYWHLSSLAQLDHNSWLILRIYDLSTAMYNNIPLLQCAIVIISLFQNCFILYLYYKICCCPLSRGGEWAAGSGGSQRTTLMWSSTNVVHRSCRWLLCCSICFYYNILLLWQSGVWRMAACCG